jgi:hypothetical protein
MGLCPRAASKSTSQPARPLPGGGGPAFRDRPYRLGQPRPPLAPLRQVQLGLPGRPSHPHGLYWHWTAKVAGKTVNRRLSDEEAVLYQEWIANDGRLRSLVNELRRIARKAIELSLAAAKTEPEV